MWREYFATATGVWKPPSSLGTICCEETPQAATRPHTDANMIINVWAVSSDQEHKNKNRDKLIKCYLIQSTLIKISGVLYCGQFVAVQEILRGWSWQTQYNQNVKERTVHAETFSLHILRITKKNLSREIIVWICMYLAFHFQITLSWIRPTVKQPNCYLILGAAALIYWKPKNHRKEQ